MRILLIGNFAPPYEEENLHNLTLLNQLRQEGHECQGINIAQGSSKDKGIVNTKNYLDFIIKLVRYGYRRNIIHFLTKGYARPGLMKLMTTVFMGKLFQTKIIITLHSELFSIFGQLRSKMGGQQLLRLSFSLADNIICADTHTYEVALTHYSVEKKFNVIPTFFHIPEDYKENELSYLKKLENKKKVIVFSGVRYPSLIFDILNDLLVKYLKPDVGIAVTITEGNYDQLKHIMEEAGNRFANNIVFIEPSDNRLLSMAYTKADLAIRTLSCDGRPLFSNIALSLKKPRRSENYLYFTTSLSLIKEGEVADLCAYIFNNLIMEKSGKLPESPAPASTQGGEDFYAKIKEIYSKTP